MNIYVLIYPDLLDERTQTLFKAAKKTCMDPRKKNKVSFTLRLLELDVP